MTLQRSSPRSEAGFALIEVVVAAAVLALVSLAVLSGIDAANGASAREKARAVAASLAELDQERLRTMAIDKIAAPPQQLPQTIDGVTYTVKSEAKWITDNVDGTPNCGEGDDQVEYLHITSTVTSNVVGENIPPVKIDSLVAPTAKKAESQGILGVKVVDRNGVGVPGITVAATSPASSPPAAVTGADGCVMFKNALVGTYTITLNTPGMIDREGNQLATTTQLVAAKKVAFVNMTYDRVTSATAAVKTMVPGTSWATANQRDSKARTVSTTNGASLGLIKKVTPAAGATTAQFTGLFPFAENSYAFFTGECGYASPDRYSTNYYSDAVNGNPLAALLSNPANPQPQPVTVRQPPFNVRIRNNRSGTQDYNHSTLQVFAKLIKPASASSDDCVEPWYQLTTVDYPSGWSTALAATTNLVSQGTTYDPGMPFGKYTICLRDTSSGTRYWKYASDYDNTTPNGQSSTLTIQPPTNGWSSTNLCTG